MSRFTLLLLLIISSVEAASSPGDSLRVPNCTAAEFEKICENTNLKFLAIGYFYSDTLPACIGNLTQLEELEICWDGYRLPIRKATVLPAIGKLTKLKSLTFSGGYLPIELPSELGNLTSLVRLRIYNLKFDSLPESLGNLVNLQDAMLCGNMKTLPSSFGNWKKMESIYMAGNVFQSIPQCVFEMNALTSLDVSDNDLKEVDEKIALLDQLGELWLGGNDYLRHMPDQICELNMLQTLDLENTMVTALPICLCTKSTLQEIRLCKGLIENPIEFNVKFSNKVRWSSSCFFSHLISNKEAFGKYTADFTNEKDSVAYHVRYAFDYPGVIDEEYWEEVTIKVPKDAQFNLNKVYPLSHSYIDLKYTLFSVWDWNSEKKPNVTGFIVFRERKRRSAEIYMRIILNENQEQEILIDRKLKFRKK
jgi:hypothetical protein